jgi:outer membrane protein TolC
MRCFCGGTLFVGLILSVSAGAQSSESFHKLLTPEVRSGKLAAPEHLKEYLKNGKLRLSLQDAVILALENNSNIRVDGTQIEANKFSLLSQYAPFDPLLSAIVNVQRYSYPGDSELQGVGEFSGATLNQLTQQEQINYSETFRTGTNVQVGVENTKLSTNNDFYFFNPSYNTSLTFQFTQPLLRNAGVFANTAPLIIARRTLQQSRASFEAQVNDAILQVITEYWAVVQARENLVVRKKSIELADASYQRDKRALELGALPPLDIYRSQSELAARQLSVIQGEYSLKQTEEALRLIIGADQDPAMRTVELELTENPEVATEPEVPGVEEVLAKALASRPELSAADLALQNDETSIKYAHNQLLPDLHMNGIYQSNGLGGNEYNPTTGALISSGGLGSSFGQLGGFGYPTYGVTLTLNLPIRNSLAQANLGTALVSRRHDLYALRQTREGIVREVNDAVHELEEAKVTLAAGKASFELAQKSLTAEQRKVELGAENNFFVLDAQSRLAQADLDLLQTQVNYQVARAAVDHATGSLLEPYHVQIRDIAK